MEWNGKYVQELMLPLMIVLCNVRRLVCFEFIVGVLSCPFDAHHPPPKQGFLPESRLHLTSPTSASHHDLTHGKTTAGRKSGGEDVVSLCIKIGQHASATAGSAIRVSLSNQCIVATCFSRRWAICQDRQDLHCLIRETTAFTSSVTRCQRDRMHVCYLDSWMICHRNVCHRNVSTSLSAIHTLPTDT